MFPRALEESGTTSRLLRARGRLALGVVVVISSLGIAACGGGERQDENEPEGEFPVEIESAEFQNRQRLAETSDLTLSVTSTGDETIPELAVTIFTDAQTAEADDDAVEEGTPPGSEGGEDVAAEDEEPEVELPGAEGAFSVITQQGNVSIPSRPVWVLEEGYPKLALEAGSGGAALDEAPPGGAEAVQSNTFSFGPLEPGETREMVWRVTPVQPGTYTVRYRIAAGLQGKAVAVTEDGGSPEGEFVIRITDAPPQTRVDDSGRVVPIDKQDLIGQAGSGR